MKKIYYYLVFDEIPDISTLISERKYDEKLIKIVTYFGHRHFICRSYNSVGKRYKMEIFIKNIEKENTRELEYNLKAIKNKEYTKDDLVTYKYNIKECKRKKKYIDKLKEVVK